jgi:hypothetical protein
MADQIEMLHRDRSQSGEQYRSDGVCTLRPWSCAGSGC